MEIDEDQRNENFLYGNYTSTVLTHATFKGLQLGSIVGPIFAVLRYRRGLTRPLYVTAVWRVTTLTLAFALGKAGYTMYNSPPIKNYDRAYR